MSEAFQYGWENHALWLALYGLGAFLLAWLLRWWLWERGKTTIIKETDSEKTLRLKNTDLEKQLAGFRYDLDEQGKLVTDLRSKINTLEADKAILSTKLASANVMAIAGSDSKVSYNGLLEPTNLQVIEGVGVNTEEVLKNAGINTWADLAATDEDRLRTILTDGGVSIKNINLTDWKKQAKLAADGEWNTLIRFQKEIDVVAGLPNTSSKAERLAMSAAGFGAASRKDFEFIHGIDRDTEKALKAAGILSWEDLATADETELKAILDNSGIKYDADNVKTWRNQAYLAINGDWGGLRNLQGGGVMSANLEAGVDETPLDYNTLLSKYDLKVIEGIGNKTERALKTAGILEWSDLAAANEATIKDALDKAGISYQADEISGWKYQAKLASEGNWDTLFQYQKDVDTKAGLPSSSSKAEKIALMTMGFSTKKSDLSIVQGLDPRAQAILKTAGIRNWADLSATTPDRLKKILGDAGYKYDSSIDSWPAQASLATSGNWAKLKAFQTNQYGKSIQENGLLALRGITDEAIKILETNGIGSIEELANADNYTLYNAFGGANDTYNWYYLRNQARYARDGEWKTFETYQSDSFALAFRPDNLQVIEGIGPKIQELLNQNGIITWANLAQETPERLREMLDEGGPTFKMHDPKSWPEQASLADADKWEDLIKYQKFLDSGRESVGTIDSPSKAEKMMVKILGIISNPDDLKIVEGIGPKIEELLKNNGINDWSDLANTTVKRLKEILASEGDRYRLAIPDTWPKQAQLADTGKWVELKTYQDYLQGGVDPAANS
jgi:predicted flap endonuclease-1-like 5' DNA nuclease